MKKARVRYVMTEIWENKKSTFKVAVYRAAYKLEEADQLMRRSFSSAREGPVLFSVCRIPGEEPLYTVSICTRVAPVMLEVTKHAGKFPEERGFRTPSADVLDWVFKDFEDSPLALSGWKRVEVRRLPVVLSSLV